MKEDALLNLFIDNLRKFFYPEEWIKIDLTLSKTELLALLIVDRHGEIIMSQIADYVRVPLSTATGIVDRLVKNKYLKRERSESDRRIVVIQLTEKGSEIVKDVKESILGYLEKINQTLTEDERQFLSNLFFKIMHRFEENHQEEPEQGNNKVKRIPID